MPAALSRSGVSLLSPMPGLLVSLAVEVGNQGVTVNAVTLGYTDSPLVESMVQAVAEDAVLLGRRNIARVILARQEPGHPFCFQFRRKA